MTQRFVIPHIETKHFSTTCKNMGIMPDHLARVLEGANSFAPVYTEVWVG